MTLVHGELMEKYCDGDGTAFEELYRQIAPGLRRYIAGMSRSVSTTDDVLQETFVKVHRRRRAYIRGADPVPWIYTIARHTLFDELRRRQRTVVETDELRAHAEVAAAAEPRADAMPRDFESRMMPATLEALQRLPWPQREAIVLTKVDGKSFAEAAEIVGVSAGAMRVRAHRGYLAIRRALGAGDP